jgi:hypothetical protein
MGTWHCPICGLDFAFHSELDWHVREAHFLKRTAGLAGQLERQAVLSWTLLRQFQAVERGTSVSLLMWTTPAALMTAADAADLHQLAAAASKQLAHELRGTALMHMQLRLDEAVQAAEGSPTDHGLAVFVSANETAIVPLPFPPRERAVVNHTFVVRELLEALQRFPMYRALLLRGPGFWLLEGRGEHLSEVLDWQVPNPSFHRARQSAWTTRQRRRSALAAADRAIAERVALVGRLPLVVMGRKRLLGEFRKRSPHAASIVGEIPTWGSMHSRASAAQLAAPLVATWREQHTARYLDALAEADRQGQVVWGPEAVWGAVSSGRAERLWVERDYGLPGHFTDEGKRLVPAHDSAAPGAVKDVIDRVIERAALAGAHVEIVDKLGLQGHEGDHIAAQLGRFLPEPAGAAALLGTGELPAMGTEELSPPPRTEDGVGPRKGGVPP